MTPVSGTVFVRLKGRRFEPLTSTRVIPTGSVVDTRGGTVRLASARDTRGRTQSGDFRAGTFQVLQSRRKSAKGLTELRLNGVELPRLRQGRRGPSPLRAARCRRLRGTAKGRFRTRGRYSSATVRGTTWEVADRCDGTLTKVTRGKVAVRDFRRGRTVLVRAGKSYLARARR